MAPAGSGCVVQRESPQSVAATETSCTSSGAQKRAQESEPHNLLRAKPRSGQPDDGHDRHQHETETKPLLRFMKFLLVPSGRLPFARFRKLLLCRFHCPSVLVHTIASTEQSKDAAHAPYPRTDSAQATGELTGELCGKGSGPLFFRLPATGAAQPAKRCDRSIVTMTLQPRSKRHHCVAQAVSKHGSRSNFRPASPLTRWQSEEENRHETPAKIRPIPDIEIRDMCRES